MPIRIDTQHINPAPTFVMPILQPFFSNPTVITHRRLSVDDIMYDVYAAHPESGVTKGNSVVVVIKRRGFEAWGARPTHLWEEDRLDAVVVIKACVPSHVLLFIYPSHFSRQIFQDACSHQLSSTKATPVKLWTGKFMSLRNVISG